MSIEIQSFAVVGFAGMIRAGLLDDLFAKAEAADKAREGSVARAVAMIPAGLTGPFVFTKSEV
jgi:hypothetical protein